MLPQLSEISTTGRKHILHGAGQNNLDVLDFRVKVEIKYIHRFPSDLIAEFI